MATGRPGTRGTTSRFLIRDSIYEDLVSVSENLIPEDVAELQASCGLEPLRALSLLHAESAETWAAEERESGIVVAVGGVYPPEDEDEPMAGVWLICTPYASEYPKSFARMVRRRIRELKLKYGILYGQVDDRHEIRRRWLNTLGFRVTNSVTRDTHLGLPFRLFVSRPS